MHPAKNIAARIYYHGTWGYRWWLLKRSSAARQAPIGVLVFHRVADDRANKWTTPTTTFSKALRWLKKNVELISLAEVQQRVAAGQNDRLRMSITFDDGYAANGEHAIPMLVEQEIPCTYFVAVDPVLKGVPFEHDVTNGRVLAPNSVADLRSYSQGGVEIGAHTRTHADLGKVTCPTRLRDEIVHSRDELQDAIGQRVRYFAFPFGRIANLSAASFQLLRTSGFAGACSAYGGYNVPGGDAFHLKRRCLDGALLRIKNWVTIDPFRNRRVDDCDVKCDGGNDGQSSLILNESRMGVGTKYTHGY